MNDLTESRKHHGDGSVVIDGPWKAAAKRRILVVEDDELLREAVAPLLTEEGYQLSFAENGQEALRQLFTDPLPNIILLDLKMPVMDGWEFRRIQKDDPKLGVIPIVVTSADESAQAETISAQAFLHKPVDPTELLSTLDRVLSESEQRLAEKMDETERLASLGRLAVNLGHEINNPLTFVMANLTLSLEALHRSMEGAAGVAEARIPPVAELERIKGRMIAIAELLEECQVGAVRIRGTVGNLQRLSRRDKGDLVILDVHKLIDESVSMARDEIRRRARLIKTFGAPSSIRGNGSALGQVFSNLLLNAAEAVPEGDPEGNEIRISTRVAAAEGGAELVVEITDSGAGIAPEALSRVFEPFFTTKRSGHGTGLGLSISRQTVIDHGGRMTIESELGIGSIVRVFLPVDASQQLSPPGVTVH
jgi:signal transduction histidine kinase